MSWRSRAITRVACLAAVIALAAAAGCNSSGDEQVASQASEVTQPPPAEPSAPPEPPPATPAEPTAPPEPPPAAPAEPPAPTTTQPTPDEPPDGPLDEEEVAALLAALNESQSEVTSSLVETGVSLSFSVDGFVAASVDEAIYLRQTTVGDLSHFQLDQAELAAIRGFEDETQPAVPADLPPLEVILDAESQTVYFKLEPLAAQFQESQPSWLSDLLATRGSDLDELELWGRWSSDAAGSFLSELGFHGPSVLEAVLEFVQLATQGESLLEARADGSSEVAGVATQAYSFVVDLSTLLRDLPPILAEFVATPGEGDLTPEEFFGSLPSVPAELEVHVDSSGYLRRLQIDLDLGSLLAGLFTGPDEDFGASADDGLSLPQFEYLVSVRLETLAVNDPSLSVTLPDPSQIIDIPEDGA